MDAFDNGYTSFIVDGPPWWYMINVEKCLSDGINEFATDKPTANYPSSNRGFAPAEGAKRADYRPTRVAEYPVAATPVSLSLAVTASYTR